MEYIEIKQPQILQKAILQATERFVKLYYPKGAKGFKVAIKRHKAAILSLVENIDRLYRNP